MNIKEIITKYLTENGFDGLCGEECGCQLGDLFPCESISPNCEPGYISHPEKHAYGWEWVITTEKPDKGAK